MTNKKDKKQLQSDPETITQNKTDNKQTKALPDSQSIKSSIEVGGRQQGLEPTRYGDWEFKGRCIDF